MFQTEADHFYRLFNLNHAADFIMLEGRKLYFTQNIFADFKLHLLIWLDMFRTLA